MKRVIWCIAMLFFLAGCYQPEETVSRIAVAELNRLEGELAGTGQEQLALQENLARWYNLNLREERDPDFRAAYGQILFYTDGIMGSLEIPDRQIHLPVYHGTDCPDGFGHDPETAFPIGETGNHPVLVTEDSLTMDVGETFIVHILGYDLHYQVAAVRQEQDTTAVPGMDYCSLIAGDGRQFLGVRLEE